MIPLSLAEVADAVHGRLDRADPAAVVRAAPVVDSRRAAPGCLFVALPGERTDGHRHAAGALARGAVAVLARTPVGGPAVLVDDPQAGLGRLAAAVLARLPGTTVVGVTGSSGKTTTKDMLAAAVAPLGPVVAAPGSYNNEIGLPLTVCEAEPATRTLVLEFSARGAGHIAYLTRLAPPHVAAVLNVGVAHLGEFGSREAIARAKSELVAGLRPGGTAVLNADDPLVAAMAGPAHRAGAAVRTFGLREPADLRAGQVRLDAQARPRFRLVRAGAPPGDPGPEVRLGYVGAHQVANALAAAAAAEACGVPLERAAAALSAARPVSRWRMELARLPGGPLVINDAYNANPESMRAALQTLAHLGAGGRRWAVLGEMAELGAAAPEAHAELGRQVAAHGVDRLVTVGEFAAVTAAAAAEAGVAVAVVAEPGAAAELLASALADGELGPGDVVLVKASRAARLERCVEALAAGAAEPCRAPAP